MTEKRLFVPLSTRAFNWFKMGKQWEVRILKGQYNPRNIFPGRIVELRRGYNTTDSLWGQIVDVKIFENSDELLRTLDFQLIIPQAKNSTEAKAELKNFAEPGKQIITFKIKLNHEFQSKTV